MEDEERHWRESQPSVDPLEKGDGSEDGMDDKDDDIIPGCYFMDLGLEGFESRTFWVRAEYIRIFDYVEEHYNKKTYPLERAPAVVVTGQPGIGAS